MTKQKNTLFSNLIWKFGERFLAQIVSFVVSIVLARMLMPEDYGVISLILVFITFADVFVTSGFSTSLIQKKDADEIDFSTIFFCSFAVSIVIYVILFFTAPLIADFYSTPILVPILRVFSLRIPISSYNSIQHAYVSRNMLFKKFFFSTLGGTLISGVLGIVLAYRGMGVWALVAQYLTNTIIDIIVLMFTVPWRPQLLFSLDRAKSLMNFGWKLVLANLINSVYNELRSLVIGRSYSSADLAYYNKGNQIPSLAITNIDTAIGNVVFPAMSAADSKKHLKSIGRRAMKTTSYVIFPIMVGLIVISKPLVLFLLTDKWNASILYMQILCLYWMTQPIQTTNWQIIKAVGRSDLCLKLEIVKKAIGIVMVLIAMKFGVFAIAVSAALFGPISMIINMLPNKKLINYSIVEQIVDILPALLASIIMGLGVHIVSLFILPELLQLVIQIIIGCFIYIAISYIFKIEAFWYIISIVCSKIKKRDK